MSTVKALLIAGPTREDWREIELPCSMDGYREALALGQHPFCQGPRLAPRVFTFVHDAGIALELPEYIRVNSDSYPHPIVGRVLVVGIDEGGDEMDLPEDGVALAEQYLVPVGADAPHRKFDLVTDEVGKPGYDFAIRTRTVERK